MKRKRPNPEGKKRTIFPTSNMNKLRKDEGFLDRNEKKDFNFFFVGVAIEYGSGNFSISYGEEYRIYMCIVPRQHGERTGGCEESYTILLFSIR